MPFITITKPSAGDPTTKDLQDNMIDNQVFLNNNIAASLGGLVSNWSFETDADSDGEADGWDYTNYTGGSNALVTTNESAGITAQSFTSTILANGGGYIDSTDYFEVVASRYYDWSYQVNASVANVSNQYQVTWYTDAKVSISTTTLNQDTNTSTAANQSSGAVQAPATARWAKVRLEGGIPGVGSMIGVIYFDAIVFGLSNPDASIRQPVLKTATASTSGSTPENGSTDITLNAYSFFPMIQQEYDIAYSSMVGHFTDGASPDNPRFAFVNRAGSGDLQNYDVDHRYIEA